MKSLRRGDKKEKKKKKKKSGKIETDRDYLRGSRKGRGKTGGEKGNRASNVTPSWGPNGFARKKFRKGEKEKKRRRPVVASGASQARNGGGKSGKKKRKKEIGRWGLLWLAYAGPRGGKNKGGGRNIWKRWATGRKRAQEKRKKGENPSSFNNRKKKKGPKKKKKKRGTKRTEGSAIRRAAVAILPEVLDREKKKKN